MNQALVLCALYVWVLQLLPSFWLRIAFSCLAALYFLFRFDSFRPFGLLLLCAGLFLFHPFVLTNHDHPPQPGAFRVEQVKKSYVIARNEAGEKVVVYEAEELCPGDEIELTLFERIHSVKNESLFCFEDYLQQKGIYYSTRGFDSRTLVCSDSLQARLYRSICSHPQSEVLRLFLYNLSNDEVQPFFLKLGFGLCAFGAWLRNRLQRWFSLEKSSLFSALFLAAGGFLLTRNLALFRMVLFFLARAFLSRWEHRWSAQVIVFLWFVPYGAAEFGFVLPVLISLV